MSWLRSPKSKSGLFPKERNSPLFFDVRSSKGLAKWSFAAGIQPSKRRYKKMFLTFAKKI
jgi:hypothetical protein